MLRVDRNKKILNPLPKPTLSEASILERQDLQEFIFNSPDAFCEELGVDLFLVGKEITPSDVVQDRIDLLAIDREGSAVIIELKRGSNKLQHMQAVSYAAMVSKWSVEDFLVHLSDERSEALTDFLDVDLEAVNRRQRVILVAEAFDYALLVACEWLNEQHGVDIGCHRLSLAKDPETSAEYLVCDQAYPPLEITQHATSRGKSRPGGKPKWTSWEEALSAVTNKAVVDFFRAELAGESDPYLRKRALRYRGGDRRRWHVHVRTPHGYVWQKGRFDGDLKFWQDLLSTPKSVAPVKNDTCLRFKLLTADDFSRFREQVRGDLAKVKWLKSNGEDPGDEA